MAVFNKLIFDDIDSAAHGVYITGQAVWNAPERDVTMITIPGRNGQLALDNGRFENIEVTYPAGVYASSMEEYAEKIRNFRNALVSRYNYVKLTDTYNLDEYRLALYKSGLEVNPHRYNTAAEFDITFECKPQRFLTEGAEPYDFVTKYEGLMDENSVQLQDEKGNDIEGGVVLSNNIINPTDYASQPLIIITGTGQVGIGDFIITVTGTEKQKLYIDCETMEIYTKNGTVLTPASSLVSFNKNEFPTIPPGSSGVSFTTQTMEIIPRWWRI